MYRKLNAERIVETVSRLRERIGERFPESSLCGVAKEFYQVASHTKEHIAWMARPNLLLRGSIALLTVLFVVIIVMIGRYLKLSTQVDRFTELMQGVDAALNTIILVGGAIFFLFTLEVRAKRNRALKRLHELRSLAHIVDMHQLTKDPESVLRGGPRTTTSPVRSMTNFELSRYLDYCSELLSLIGKVSALYVENYDDPVVLDAVEQVEDLTTALSNKIWQKIMILNAGWRE